MLPIGNERWLEIGVRPGNSIDAYVYLAPRQPLTATPYAFSLWPGALITGENSTSGAVLNVWNTGIGSGQTAVYGWARNGINSTYGVKGQSDSPFGRGVYGVASETDGSGFGIHG